MHDDSMIMINILEPQPRAACLCSLYLALPDYLRKQTIGGKLSQISRWFNQVDKPYLQDHTDLSPNI